MLWMLIGQVSLIGEHAYSGASSVYLYADANGDGVFDAVVFYGDTLIKVYDSISDNLLATFRAPAGYSVYNLYVLGNGRFLYSAFDYTAPPYKYRFFVYDNFNSLLFQSPDFYFNRTGYAYPWDFNGDGYIEIIAYADSTVRVYGTPFTKTRENHNPMRGEFTFDAVVSSGRFQLPAIFPSDGKLTVMNSAGKVVLKRNLIPQEREIPLKLPSGTYIYRLESRNISIGGKLIVR